MKAPLAFGHAARFALDASIAEARTLASREGGARRLVASRVEGRETGAIWPPAQPGGRPGPLDGQPRRDWFYIATYSDGSQETWGPGGARVS